MIYGTISDIINNKCFCDKIADAVKKTIAMEPEKLDDGKYILDDDSFFSVQSYETSPEELRKFEAHKEYIDIQMILSGRESIKVLPVDVLIQDSEFDNDKDIGFYKSDKTPVSLLMNSGEFAVFFPEDGHKPCCSAGANPEEVLKVVIKIKSKNFQA